MRSPRLQASVAVLCAAFFALPALAQLSERPGLSTDMDRVNLPKDVTGKSIKNRRIRIAHTTDPLLAGGSMYFQAIDPWLGYQLGRNMEQRQYRLRDGIFPDVSALGGVSSDGFTPEITTQHVTSCGDCHNVPYRGNGGGTNIASHSGDGRNTPHFMGAGLMDMIGIQTRLKILGQGDLNRDGWLARTESQGVRILVPPTATAAPIDFGTFGDPDGDGKPNLNPVLVPYYLNASGQWIPTATSLNDPGVAGYNFIMRHFGWGELFGGNQSHVRVFFWGPFQNFKGIQTFDPTVNTDPDGDGLSGVSNAGAQQFAIFSTVDKGTNKISLPSGFTVSLDDPDGDGHLEELTEGDADIGEWYLLNAPAPARIRPYGFSELGRRNFETIGCAACHVPDWQIEPADPFNADYTRRFAGDRRFFDLEVAWNKTAKRLEGKLVSLSRSEGLLTVPKRAGFLVEGVYSDFAFHDVGPNFYETQFDGSVIKQWRTAPLWGAGSIPPFGHDGKSFTLDDVIRRHGGEAEASAAAYRNGSKKLRASIVAFLESLVVYQPDDLPTDIDGDGVISPAFMVAGRDTGEEKFNPEWLFRNPVQIEGMITAPDGTRTRSLAATNIQNAYGELLPFYADTDGDGWPDVLDQAPNTPGFKDGLNN